MKMTKVPTRIPRPERRSQRARTRRPQTRFQYKMFDLRQTRVEPLRGCKEASHAMHRTVQNVKLIITVRLCSGFV
jgi:hypothetical protein